ncbi:MAG: sensor domain-containing protein [Mycobacterium sp.]|uniref:serine/threonine-protein kinase PknH/PknJ n=1 Tax=Mycobacterium sp. TaxID=1785 RepID=UPI001EBC65AE|nr:sensor domain-containing protein [Mycobacterium sp.]MBW0016638.1 sensor domain-containing protein [Mycobacterium sp.]
MALFERWIGTIASRILATEGLPVDEVVFGRYRLLSVIGEGGMGRVYRAHDTVIGRDVAIKVLSADLSAEPGYQERFRREAHIAARLAEPHIIPIHDTGEIDGQLYLVMPVVQGTNIQDLLERDGPMSPRRAAGVIEQLAAALDAAHTVGLVHRDVKPSNALVTARDFTYLIDFGIAHDSAATKLTRTGTIVGSWAYMAPERFSAGSADARADIYALACVLHECLTGAQPYPGDSLEQQFTGHYSLEPPRPSGLNPSVPTGFDEVIARGMAKDPNHRYQSAYDLATAANHALATQPASTVVHGRPPPAPTAALQPLWQQSAPANDVAPPQGASGWGFAPQAQPALAGAPQAAAPPAAPAYWPTPAGSPPSAPQWQPRRRRKWPLITGAAVTLAVVVSVAAYLLLGGRTASRTPTAQPAPASSPTPSTAPAPASSTAQAPAPSANGLDGLLLSADQINAAMDTTGMTSVGTMTTMPDQSSFVSDKACLPLAYAVQASVYAGSGSSDMRAQVLAKGQQNAVTQAVVLFSSAHDAASFFTASTQSWGSCSNRQFTIAINGNSQLHTVGPVSNANGILSATVTPANSAGTCERALTVANNVAVDVTVCLGPPTAAVDIARQIGAKVPKS